MSSIATLSQSLDAASKDVRLLPAGTFRANDGRPNGIPSWLMTAEIAEKIIMEASLRDDMIIDFEHQSMKTEKNGQPAPAAGWIDRLEWREGQGLFAVDVKWTPKAKAMIASREYRYISPVFYFDPVTGVVNKLVNAALTNTPALSGLTDLSTIAVNSEWMKMESQNENPGSIEAFNQVFGQHGIFHPQTPSERIAELTGNVPKPKLSGDMTPQQKENMRQAFPGVFVLD